MDQSEKTDANPNDSVDSKGFGTKGEIAQVALMPVSADAMYYNMNHPKRGLAIIFNHEKFNAASLKDRTGTKVDCENLRKNLEDLGFSVNVYHDLTSTEVFAEVSKAVKYDHSDCDSFVLAVLSHGEKGILHAKDLPYNPEFLWTSFSADKCPKLAGKPKLFFIQACQGDKLDQGITLRTETDGNGASYRIPTQADFLIAYSTIPGYFSWRNTTYGSWFIQALSWELRHHGTKYDILTLLTFVAQRVAIDFESNVPNNSIMHKQKQIPCVTTMLTRLLRFNSKK